ncbi:N-acetyl sugar amidotransferase [Butyrivibrio sp. CB08]|nr:N-acetyl sugar amidotransferase [Butyrivibrio sp. CB08]RKM57891.1 N-acetyl sugar amidotransferase [Butyrivibrio sp. CB08]
MDYQICTRCIMDNKSDPLITFDNNGVCNHCRDFDSVVDKLPKTDQEKEIAFNSIIQEIKEHGKGKEFDCVLGISGGVDSAYLAYIAKKAGLRILATHVDAGWNTDVAVENIKKLCKALDIELHTIVVDWTTIKELQRAYMFSGLPNLDVVQDHAFLAGTYKFARKYGIDYMLNGSNYQTEGILPSNYGYAAIDYKNIKDVYKKCGRGKVSLRKYPKMSLFTYSLTYLGKTKRVNLLNYVPYSKKMAIEVLHNEFDWNYYGGKHFESRFTKFFQSYYLPKKFRYEKKRAHISSLIVGGEISREEGLREMSDDSAYTEVQMLEDRDYILKKLDISIDEWNALMAAPNKTEDDYKNNKKLMKLMQSVKRRIKK